MTRSPLRCCTSIIRSSALVQASSTLSMVRTHAVSAAKAWPRSSSKAWPRPRLGRGAHPRLGRGQGLVAELILHKILFSPLFSRPSISMAIKGTLFLDIFQFLGAHCAVATKQNRTGRVSLLGSTRNELKLWVSRLPCSDLRLTQPKSKFKFRGQNELPANGKGTPIEDQFCTMKSQTS